ncbi:MAG: hypothetical protein ABJD07_00315 [Gemmatimonadaceae bacterium]
MTRKTACSIALAAALASAGTVGAQMSPMARLAVRLDTAPSAAEQLHERGLAYTSHGTVEAMRDAARFHELSASKRQEDDLQSARCLREAAQMRYAVGEVAVARKLMVQSAERAAALGDVVNAAESYLDAAWLSSELRDFTFARDYTTKAKLLAASPLLTGEQRTAIRARMAE